MEQLGLPRKSPHDEAVCILAHPPQALHPFRSENLPSQTRQDENEEPRQRHAEETNRDHDGLDLLRRGRAAHDANAAKAQRVPKSFG